MRTYGAGYWRTLCQLRIPVALPFVFNALKINSTLALIGAIVAEFFGSPMSGLGFRISHRGGAAEHGAGVGGDRGRRGGRLAALRGCSHWVERRSDVLASVDPHGMMSAFNHRRKAQQPRSDDDAQDHSALLVAAGLLRPAPPPRRTRSRCS